MMMLSIETPMDNNNNNDENNNLEEIFPKDEVSIDESNNTSNSSTDFSPPATPESHHEHHHHDHLVQAHHHHHHHSMSRSTTPSPTRLVTDESSNDSITSLREGEEEGEDMGSSSEVDPDQPQQHSSNLQEDVRFERPASTTTTTSHRNSSRTVVSDPSSLHHPEPLAIPLYLSSSCQPPQVSSSGIITSSSGDQQQKQQPNTTMRTDPRILPTGCQGVKFLGEKFLLFDQVDGGSLHKCIAVETKEEFICKVLPIHSSGHALLAAHYRVEGSEHINPIREVILGSRKAYLLFSKYSTDLHSYVRSKRRLKEPQARHLFKQIVLAVKEAHVKGIVLRDLKLRKFIFTSDSRLELKLESLEDAVVLDESGDDWLSDKHGCPAYVSPEILKCNTRYSGRAADMWGLGVMLYTMLVGRYPFHGQEHSGLFAKIRRGHFSLPDTLSSRAKCLIRCLLRKEPEERLDTEEVLSHPWLTHQSSRERTKRVAATLFSPGTECVDQKVPELPKEKKDFEEPLKKKLKTE